MAIKGRQHTYLSPTARHTDSLSDRQYLQYEWTYTTSILYNPTSMEIFLLDTSKTRKTPFDEQTLYEFTSCDASWAANQTDRQTQTSHNHGGRSVFKNVLPCTSTLKRPHVLSSSKSDSISSIAMPCLELSPALHLLAAAHLRMGFWFVIFSTW